jgi:hypothetical protein
MYIVVYDEEVDNIATVCEEGEPFYIHVYATEADAFAAIRASNLRAACFKLHARTRYDVVHVDA